MHIQARKKDKHAGNTSDLRKDKTSAPRFALHFRQHRSKENMLICTALLFQGATKKVMNEIYSSNIKALKGPPSPDSGYKHTYSQEREGLP